MNDSEVTAVYSAAFSVTNTSIPIEFKVGEGAWGNTLTTPVTGTLPMDNASSTEDEGAATVTVYWRWPFTDNTSTDASAARDASDTTLGLAGTASVTVTANVTVTQVD